MIHDAWQYLHNILKDKENGTNLNIMDNKASSDMKGEMIKDEINYQLDPPHMHRSNSLQKYL